MIEKLVLIIVAEMKIVSFVINLISTNTKFEVTWSVLIYVHFNYPGFSFNCISSKLSWVVSFIIYVHYYL